jgi:hypothetical protein
MRFLIVELLSAVSVPALVCYDNEGGDLGAGAGAGAGDAGGSAEGQGSAKAFTQDDINRVLAEDRRKHAQKMAALEAKIGDLTKNSQMTQQQRDELETSVEDMKKQFQTKEQLAAQEKMKLEGQYKTKLTETEDRAKLYETKFIDSTIHRSLADAAMANEAFNVQQVIALLRPKTKLLNDVPVVDFDDVNVETGEAIVTQLSPMDAVKRMRELANVHGNLFKSNVVTGVGASNGSAQQGKVDVRKLSPQQYAKLRKENPSALGL